MVIPELIQIQPNQISKETGHCFTVSLPELQEVACSPDVPLSPYVLFEDDVPQEPSNALHDIVRNEGMGAHSHWGESLMFSTSDNSDPRTNNRRYTFKNMNNSQQPVNYRQQGVSAEELDRDADYAINVGMGYWELLEKAGFRTLKGMTLMEIGPGINFGSAVILACLGAEKTFVTDRFLSRWSAPYHDPFYKRLKEKLQELPQSLDLAPLEQVLANGGYEGSRIAPIETPLEHLNGIGDKEVDVILSNAVFEHLVDPQTAFQQLNRVSKVGGLGFHQVDFRDHRDFSSPLEFLLLKDRKFKKLFENCHAECGNRYRPKEMGSITEECGFELIKYSSNMDAASEYLEGFMRRLATSGSSYSKWDKKDLTSISGRLFIKKKYDIKISPQGMMQKVGKLLWK